MWIYSTALYSFILCIHLVDEISVLVHATGTLALTETVATSQIPCTQRPAQDLCVLAEQRWEQESGQSQSTCGWRRIVGERKITQTRTCCTEPLRRIAVCNALYALYLLSWKSKGCSTSVACVFISHEWSEVKWSEVESTCDFNTPTSDEVLVLVPVLLQVWYHWQFAEPWILHA